MFILWNKFSSLQVVSLDLARTRVYKGSITNPNSMDSFGPQCLDALDFDVMKWEAQSYPYDEKVSPTEWGYEPLKLMRKAGESWPDYHTRQEAFNQAILERNKMTV